MIEFKWSDQGLIPAVIQDAESHEVLMVAYMDKESVRRTLEKKLTCFYSRSRKEYWIKGESSGHTQEVVDVLTDCDKDTLLIRVKQKGGACHLGYKSCFVHRLDAKGEAAGVTQEKVFDPARVYKSK